MTRDFTELDRQIDNAEAHALDASAPGRKWNQSAWVAPCGTYGCIAGNTALDAGYKLKTTGWAQLDGRSESVETVARELLGLTPNEAGEMFEPRNTIETLRKLQKHLHNGEPILPDMAARYSDVEQYES